MHHHSIGGASTEELGGWDLPVGLGLLSIVRDVADGPIILQIL